MDPTVQTAKRGTVWPFGWLELCWLGSAPKLGCDGAGTTHKQTCSHLYSLIASRRGLAGSPFFWSLNGSATPNRPLWRRPGYLYKQRSPTECVTRGVQTVMRRSKTHGESLSDTSGLSAGHKRYVPPESAQASKTLRRDLLCLGSTSGESLPGLHVVHTWPLGWTIGSIGRDSLIVCSRANAFFL